VTHPVIVTIAPSLLAFPVVACVLLARSCADATAEHARAAATIQ
jgi:hypothetical protein